MSTDDKQETSAYAAPENVDSSPSSSIAEFAGINEKSLLRKLDLRLLPPLTLLYLLSFLDRSNGSFALILHSTRNMLWLTDCCSWQCPVGRNDGRYQNEYAVPQTYYMEYSAKT